MNHIKAVKNKVKSLACMLLLLAFCSCAAKTEPPSIIDLTVADDRYLFGGFEFGTHYEDVLNGLSKDDEILISENGTNGGIIGARIKMPDFPDIEIIAVYDFINDVLETGRYTIPIGTHEGAIREFDALVADYKERGMPTRPSPTFEEDYQSVLNYNQGSVHWVSLDDYDRYPGLSVHVYTRGIVVSTLAQWELNHDPVE